MRSLEPASRPWFDYEQTRTYRAEGAWHQAHLTDDELHTMADVDHLLRELVHPVLADRVALEQLPGTASDTLGQLVYTEWYQWRLRVALPVHPCTVLHEAAHLLLESCGGCDIHDHQFRATLVWLARRHYGNRVANHLRRTYREHGLR